MRNLHNSSSEKDEIDATVPTFVLLAADSNATFFDPFLGSSSGVQEYWYW
jgi:hypothetical protein